MAEQPCNSRLQSMLQAAVQNIHWTYSLFWKLCPQQGVLVWSDGYYNGAIKTRKTVQPIEVSTEEATLQRSQQLRELYESLSTGETRRPSAALSPEDLTESEWFYLMCVSFSFPPGIGLPGQAYVKQQQQHIWLTEANEADSKVFSRAILAKSAGIQTVVCIPLLDGVVEIGTIEKVEEDIGVIQRVKTFFIIDRNNPNPPMPALSEHSTSNPTQSFQSPAALPCEPNDPTLHSITQLYAAEEDEEDEEDDDDDDDDDDESYSEARVHALTGSLDEPSELMQLDMSEDIRLGSLDDDASNHLEPPDFHLLTVSHSPDHHHNGDSSHSLYSQTVSKILDQWPPSNPSSAISSGPSSSAFCKWNPLPSPTSGSAQSTLKYILFTVPALHIKSREPSDVVSGSHVLAERRRREKLKERFIILRSLVPFVTKMDKASILGDTIEYVKQLRRRIQELEAEKMMMMMIKKKKKKKRKKQNLGEEEGAVEVSIIERDALVEIRWWHREGMLLEMMQVLRGMKMEVTTVQSSIENGVFAAELRAKLKEEVKDRKGSIMKVKRSINEVILRPN